MAQVRHRTFEIFDFEQEASDALATKSARVNTYALDPDLWRFLQLDVTIRPTGVTHVMFKNPTMVNAESISELRKDFADLAEHLTNGSRVLLDFAGVTEFDRDAVIKIGEFRVVLQNKGSRVVLCNLDTEARASFFPNLIKDNAK
ncbi:hypothetical protein LF1_13590 [Rubripirellula obstinata]|uniref:STAS domain-containing protein n=1 Tax=Rubripirellula obstinata TaxID=406547 RepID=A0A5B1CFY6_9BACT|nr:hypothetical protein [Rubripirellula obstinata]KAA1258835.1 hypothetical protein LF1_13590 [Rubripirellula obstinata]